MRDRRELQSLYLHTVQKNNDMVYIIIEYTDLIEYYTFKVRI